MQLFQREKVKSTYIDFKPERFFYGLGAVEWVRVRSGDYRNRDVDESGASDRESDGWR